MFTDLACSLGAILLEQYIVDDLLRRPRGLFLSATPMHGPTRASLSSAPRRRSPARPGTMIYGATTMYGANHAANYAALATYLRVDIYGEKTRPAGHAVNPTPVTEAERIPDIDEIIDVHMFANRLVELDTAAARVSTAKRRSTRSPTGSSKGGRQFRDNVLDRLRGSRDRHPQPFEMLLAIRRSARNGWRSLFGPGKPAPGRLRGRNAARALPFDRAARAGRRRPGRPHDAAGPGAASPRAGFAACIATTDVHEYGKDPRRDGSARDLESRSSMAASRPIPTTWPTRRGRPAPTSSRCPPTMALRCNSFTSSRASSMHGIARCRCSSAASSTAIPDGSNTSLPVDISEELASAGATVCKSVDSMIASLGEMARARGLSSAS